MNPPTTYYPRWGLTDNYGPIPFAYVVYGARLWPSYAYLLISHLGDQDD